MSGIFQIQNVRILQDMFRTEVLVPRALCFKQYGYILINIAVKGGDEGRMV